MPCPGCFLTRATAAALTGDLSTSLLLHGFGPGVAGGLVLWSVMAIRRRQMMPFRLRRGPFVLAAVGLGAFWLLRLVLTYRFGVVGGLGFPSPD